MERRRRALALHRRDGATQSRRRSLKTRPSAYDQQTHGCPELLEGPSSCGRSAAPIWRRRESFARQAETDPVTLVGQFDRSAQLWLVGPEFNSLFWTAFWPSLFA